MDKLSTKDEVYQTSTCLLEFGIHKKLMVWLYQYILIFSNLCLKLKFCIFSCGIARVGVFLCFNEAIEHSSFTSLAILFLIIGILGISFYSPKFKWLKPALTLLSNFWMVLSFWIGLAYFETSVACYFLLLCFT